MNELKIITNESGVPNVKVPADLAALPKYETDVLLMYLVELLKAEHEEFGGHTNFKGDSFVEDFNSAVREIDFLGHCADYLKNCRQGNKADPENCVYAIKFSDGAVKVGHSKFADVRIQTLTACNQSTYDKTHVVVVADYKGLERAAHKHFEYARMNGEHFSEDFDVIVSWLDANSEGFQKKLTKK